MRPTHWLPRFVLAGLCACGSGSSPPTPATFTIGGTIAGLTSTGLLLATPGQVDLAVAPGQTSFTFATEVVEGTPFAVSVVSQPGPTQRCEIAGGAGVVGAADVTGIAVTCADVPRHVIGGTIVGLTGTGLVLATPGQPNVAPEPGATAFAFPDAVLEGTAYAVSVVAQPTGPRQVCTVTGGIGAVGGADVDDVSVSCVDGPRYAIGGRVTALEGYGLRLATPGQPSLSVSPGQTSFVFPNEVEPDTAYDVTVEAQPSIPGQVCTVTSGAGTVVDADVTTVAVSCSAPRFYALRGTVRGYRGSGLVVGAWNQPNAHVPQGASSFAFELPVRDASAYGAWVEQQPTNPRQYCIVTAGWRDYPPLLVGGADAVVELTCVDDTAFLEGPQTLAHLTSPHWLCNATAFAGSDDADAPIYALTAGHCVGPALPVSDEVVLGAAPEYLASYRVKLDAYPEGPRLEARVVQIVYATMWNHDVAILELDQGRAALEAAGMTIPGLATAPLTSGLASTFGIRNEVVPRTECSLGGRVPVLEHVWAWPTALRGSCDLTFLVHGSSGSPLFALGDTTRIAGVLGTVSAEEPLELCALDAPCELRDGQRVNVPMTAYFHDVSRLSGCFDAGGTFDRALAACRLPRSTFSLKRTSADSAEAVPHAGLDPAGPYRWRITTLAAFDPADPSGYGEPTLARSITFVRPGAEWVLSAVHEEDWDPLALDPLAVHVLVGRD